MNSIVQILWSIVTLGWAISFARFGYLFLLKVGIVKSELNAEIRAKALLPFVLSVPTVYLLINDLYRQNLWLSFIYIAVTFTAAVYSFKWLWSYRACKRQQ